MTIACLKYRLPRMDEQPGDEATPKTVDLQLHKLARDLENHLGGLFGIERRDIERAIQRMQAGSEESVPALPDPIQRGAVLLEAFAELARARIRDEDFTAVAALVELLDHTRQQILTDLDE